MKDFLFSFSLANLLFYKVYSEFFVLYRSPVTQDYTNSISLPGDPVATLANIALVTLVLWPISRYASTGRVRFARTASRALQFVLFLLALYWILRIHDVAPIGVYGRLRSLAILVSIEHADAIVLFGLSALLLLIAITCAFGGRLRHQFIVGFVALVHILAPFGLVVIAQLAYWALHYEQIAKPADWQPVAVEREPTIPTSTLIVIIFDELDYRLAFGDRPRALSLPELDRLASQAVFATNAYPPSNSTLISIPALTTGLMLSSVTPAEPADLLLHSIGGESVEPWSATPNLFSAAQSAGIGVAVVGWTLPYCRVFRDAISRCYSPRELELTRRIGGTHMERMARQARSIVETPNFSPFGQSLVVEHAVRQHVGLIEAAFSVTGDKRFGLVYLHFSIPHAPNIFDSASGTLTRSNDPVRGYTENLRLVDMTLGRLRAQLEKMGQWDESTVLLTSDHWWRYSKQFDGKADHRVPFLIKLPNQRERLTFDPPFNTVIFFELGVDLLRAKIHSPQHLLDWLTSKVQYQAPVETPGFN